MNYTKHIISILFELFQKVKKEEILFNSLSCPLNVKKTLQEKRKKSMTRKCGKNSKKKFGRLNPTIYKNTNI